MSRFIKLTYYHDKSPIWVNPAHIVSFMACQPGYAYTNGARTVVNMLGPDDSTICVVEDPLDVAIKIGGEAP